MIPYRFDRKLKKQWKSNRQNKENEKNVKITNSKDKMLAKNGTTTTRTSVDNLKLKNTNNDVPSFSNKAQRSKS
jgi:hypothetical protein